ncbi:hypothetical protein SAMN05421767_10716 [Granulicatella balaenopterae]|uniref:Uncharacterized protein n=1 Tax=Granulicatella balaenopterae TaxID=137733 RepID=A0A1H9IYK1_9LACT|nr:hypothetical protein [Granulicatella balaenopterae]SEQ79465.1 hypothetical protein SAMN05421767_10716 [Granulicatella balaenopterae]
MNIFKKYLQIYKENSYSILSIKNIAIVIVVSLLFYLNGKSNDTNILNIIVVTLFSILAIMFSGDCIQNELFEKVNNDLFKQEPLAKKLLASNMTFLTNIILYIISLTTVNVYFSGFPLALAQLIKLLFVILLSIAIGNLLLITNKKIIMFNIANNTGLLKYKAINQLAKQAIISIVLGLILIYCVYDVNIIYLIGISTFAYIGSLLLNKQY